MLFDGIGRKCGSTASVVMYILPEYILEVLPVFIHFVLIGSIVLVVLVRFFTHFKDCSVGKISNAFKAQRQK